MTGQRTIVGGVRVCVACKLSDAKCTCDNETHDSFLRRFFGSKSHGKQQRAVKRSTQGQGPQRQNWPRQEKRGMGALPDEQVSSGAVVQRD